MSEPKRIQRQRAKGWKMPEGAVYVGRPGKFGNPFPVDIYGAERAVDLFRRWLLGDMSSSELASMSRSDRWSTPPGISLWTVRRWVLDDLPVLQGKTLACWCRPGTPCHADVLLALASNAKKPSPASG